MNLLAMEEMQKIKQAIASAQPDDPCPCGSGKKFRQCHGRKQSVTSR
jgi:preprotein translocase subunit SecA